MTNHQTTAGSPLRESRPLAGVPGALTPSPASKDAFMDASASQTGLSPTAEPVPVSSANAASIPSAMVSCPRCGSRHKADASDTAGEWKPIRIAEGFCNICAIGEHRARIYAAGRGVRWLIVNGKMMSPEAPVALGAPDPQPSKPSNWKGCSGSRWDFQRDGCEPQTTYSMWHGGEVDQFCRERMPDNGRLLTKDEVASAMSVRQDQDPQGLEAKPASAVPQADAQGEVA